MDIPNDNGQKALFALMLLESPDNPFVAAMKVFPDDTSAALWISRHWLADPEVIAERKKLRESGAELDNLPTKADLCREAWNLCTTGCYEDRIKAMKLYADLRAFIEKPQAAVNVNVNNNRVMIVRDKGTNEEWESGMAKQQSDLIKNASATRH